MLLFTDFCQLSKVKYIPRYLYGRYGTPNGTLHDSSVCITYCSGRHLLITYVFFCFPYINGWHFSVAFTLAYDRYLGVPYSASVLSFVAATVLGPFRLWVRESSLWVEVWSERSLNQRSPLHAFPRLSFFSVCVVCIHIDYVSIGT